MCILLTHSSENGRSGSSLKPSSTAKTEQKVCETSRDLTFVSKLAVSLAKLTVELEFEHGK